MDIAVNLVETYLRLNGYLTLSEFEVQARNGRGDFETITDVDIMALRFPGEVLAAYEHDGVDCREVVIEDAELRLESDLIDVILGEVKQGLATFNPGLRRREVLHTMLHRISWLFAGSRDDAIVDDLQRTGVSMVPARGGGTVRIRLVAFGRTAGNDLNTMSTRHIVETMLRLFAGTDDAFRPVQFRDPAPAMLSLLLKTGFRIDQGPA